MNDPWERARKIVDEMGASVERNERAQRERNQQIRERDFWSILNRLPGVNQKGKGLTHKEIVNMTDLSGKIITKRLQALMNRKEPLVKVVRGIYYRRTY